MPSALLYLMGALDSEAWHRNGLSGCRLGSMFKGQIEAVLRQS